MCYALTLHHKLRAVGAVEVERVDSSLNGEEFGQVYSSFERVAATLKHDASAVVEAPSGDRERFERR